MADIIQEGAEMLAEEQTANISQPITYWRCDKSVALVATIGFTDFQVQDGGTGLASEWESKDWIVAPEDLLIDGEQITPEVGDEIVWEFGGLTKTFTVLAPADAHVAREHGPYRLKLRIHTKLVTLQ